MKRDYFARLGLGVMLSLVLFLHPSSSTLAQGEFPAELIQFQDAGAVVTMLGSAAFGQSPDGNQAMTLSRVVPVGGETISIVIAGGQELWFVESGKLTLTSDTGMITTAETGEEAVVTEPGQYTVQFDGEQCPSALRLELSSIIAMRMTSDEVAPELGPDGLPCPTGGTLIEAASTVSPRPVPAVGFIARLSLTPELFLAALPFSGPVGYAVERGTVNVSGPENVNFGLTAGSWASLATGQVHSLVVPGGNESSVLMIGAFATGEADTTVHPTPTPLAGVTGNSYLSPSYGYSLSWDESWSVVAESSDGFADSLQLSNGVSQFYLQSYGAMTGDAITCIDQIAAQLPTQTGFANVHFRETADGKPIISGDAQRRLAVFDFTYSGTAGTADYTEYVECRLLPSGGSAVVITHIVLADGYSGEIEPVRQLLTSLDLGETG